MDKKDLILVVDDNSECRESLLWTLELNGFQPFPAASGAEAVELAIEHQPRLVLMDLSMPDLDGFDAAQTIHAHPRGRKIPLVAVSSYCSDCRYVIRAFESGFLACLGKPWEQEDLLRVVNRVLRGAIKAQPSLQHFGGHGC
jgi:CheY-like chemotaxis protein